MTFESLAKLVADDFRKTMYEEGFKTFNEMKKCYCWDARDIKEEVDYTITKYANETGASVYMFDDHSAVEVDLDVMSWREFKKLVFDALEGKENDNV